MMGLAALLGSVAMHADAQPAAPTPVVLPAPIASDAVIITSPPKTATVPVPVMSQPTPIPPGIALPPATPPIAVDAPVNPDLNPAPPAAPSADAPALPVVPGGEMPPVEPDSAAAGEPTTPIGFDGFGASIFYKPNDISKLRTALDIADALARKAAMGVATKIEEAIMPTPEPPKIEISEYPVFHLSSVMYQGQGKWVIWLNGTRTTSKNLPPDLSVIGINTQQVRFSWKPQIMAALQSRWKSEEGDASKTQLKKLLSGGNLVAVDDKTGVVNFTLRPNQTYSSAYNTVLEGRQTAVSVGGDSGTIDVGSFEQTLRDAQQSEQQARPSSIIPPVNRLPRVIRPDRAATAQQPGAPALGTNNPAVQQPAPRRSGLVTPDAATIGQVPSIFPGGVPAAAIPRPARPVQTVPDPGLPILPPGAQ